MEEVRCCCEPDNLIGYVPREAGEAAGLTLRELEPEGMAFDSNHDADAVREIPGFLDASAATSSRLPGKTWKKEGKGGKGGTKRWK